MSRANKQHSAHSFIRYLFMSTFRAKERCLPFRGPGGAVRKDKNFKL